MFLSPILYVINALLTGVFMFVAATLNATAGFSFSAGLIDFVLSSRMPLSKPTAFTDSYWNCHGSFIFLYL